MNNSIQLLDRSIEYSLRTTTRSRNIRLAVYHGGSLVVTAPPRVSQPAIERFIREKARWIIKNIDYFKQFKPKLSLGSSREYYMKYRVDALKLVHEHLARFNEHYDFSYQRVTIRNQKSRWGSCSRKGNLSFNYKIALLPVRLAAYIVVHELCHLKELNHSPRFWQLVSEAIPDYKAIKKELKFQDLLFY